MLFEDALSQGFAVASHALDNAGHNCNIVTQAESLIMTKEMVVERFGPIRYTIGSGCSGGSLVQQQVANAYPGVYQGITPQCSFTDAWSSAQQYVDYVGLRNYLEGEGSVESGILPAQWAGIYGHANPANAIDFTTAIPNSGEPTRDCPGVPAEDVYDATTRTGCAAASRTTWSTSSASAPTARPAGRSATSASSTACPACSPASTRPCTAATRPARR